MDLLLAHGAKYLPLLKPPAIRVGPLFDLPLGCGLQVSTLLFSYTYLALS